MKFKYRDSVCGSHPFYGYFVGTVQDTVDGMYDDPRRYKVSVELLDHLGEAETFWCSEDLLTLKPSEETKESK